MMDLTREYYEAVRDCTPEDCGDCILRPATNRACYTVDVDPGKEARMILGLMDERDALRARVAELEAENARIIQEWAISEAAARGGAPRPDTELRGIFAERDRLREALERIQTMTVLEWQGTARGCYIIAGKALEPRCGRRRTHPTAKGKRRGFSRPLDPLVMRFLEVTHETLSKHVDR